MGANVRGTGMEFLSILFFSGLMPKVRCLVSKAIFLPFLQICRKNALCCSSHTHPSRTALGRYHSSEPTMGQRADRATYDQRAVRVPLARSLYAVHRPITEGIGQTLWMDEVCGLRMAVPLSL